MNGAVARSPAIVFTSGVSATVTAVAGGVVRRAADERERIELGVRQRAGTAGLNVVVVKNTMSPATAGNDVTFSSTLIVVPARPSSSAA